MAADTPAEDALASAFSDEREWVSKHVTMGALWNPLRALKLIDKREEDILKKEVEEDQVGKLIDTLDQRRKLGEFFKLLMKKRHEHVIEHLAPLIERFEAQHCVEKAVEDQADQGPSQIGAAEGETLMDIK